MSDMQVLLRGGVTWFAANSDREPSEPQYVVRIPEADNDQSAVVSCTHIQVPQTARRHALILNKPSWTWGGTMGVSDQGVTIGNAAIPDKLNREASDGLLGADLVRLALERSYNAEEAIDVIAELLEEYGQGGPGGYRDKSFSPDNSFVVADREQVWIMETADRFWAARCVGRHRDLLGESKYAAVSNCLTIGQDFDRCSRELQDHARQRGLWDGQGEFNFRAVFGTQPQGFLGGAEKRQAASENSLAAFADGDEPELPQFFANLRRHAVASNHFNKHGNEDICLHAAGKSRPAQTCGSMVARLVEKGRDDYLFTGSSAPCLSVFKPVDFNSSVPYHFLHEVTVQDSLSYWHRSESMHRRALFNATFHEALHESQLEVENEIGCWLNEANPLEGAGYAEADQIAAQWHERWFANAQELPMDTDFLSFYGTFWKGLNRQDMII